MLAYICLKRFADVVLSLLALILLSPLLVLLAVIIKLDSKGPVFLKQIRVGKKKKNFIIYKFRTMSINAPPDVAACLLKDPFAYITGVGKWLRRTSIDEIPQLFNILQGNMSFVGPRPIVTTEVKLVALRDKYGVYTLKPGLTGWAQVNGRDCVDYKDKAKLDAYYLEHFGFRMDMKVFFKTVMCVVTMKGIHEGSFTRSETYHEEPPKENKDK